MEVKYGANNSFSTCNECGKEANFMCFIKFELGRFMLCIKCLEKFADLLKREVTNH